MKRLILIHGRSQQGKNPDVLKSEWVTAFKRGLEYCKLTLPEDLEIILPYYGDLLINLVNEWKSGKGSQDVISRGAGSSDELAFTFEFMEEMVENVGIKNEEVLANFEGAAIERGIKNWPWVLALARTLDGTGLGEGSISAFTRDVYAYLTVPKIQKQVNDIVFSTFNDEPAVVVGHSLGSIVGYDVLRSNANFDVKEYITVGSPMGIRSVIDKLIRPFEMPSCVKSGWFNAYDKKDMVALRPVQPSLKLNPAVTDYDLVSNHTSNKHGIEGYLDDPAVAHRIYRALQ